MAAPQIPDLRTLRGGGGRGRGNGRGRPDRPQRSDSQERTARDVIVQQTDQDASVSRLSAVMMGYMDDPFARLFVSKESTRYPIINRGTYVRTRSLDSLIEHFLGSLGSSRKQIISLGAGSDTRYFRLIQQNPDLRSDLLYHEIDFPTNTAQKVRTIRRSPQLCQLAGISRTQPDDTIPADSLDGASYHVHSLDLRDLDRNKDLSASLRHVDRSLPSLILSECCLVYLDPNLADGVAKYFTEFLFPPDTPLGMILYEPLKPDDPFGKVMVSNLAARGIELQTLRKYGTLEAQAARMKAYGFEGSKGLYINELWDSGTDEAEKMRIARLEMVDEVEEWELLAGHYGVVWAWRGNKDGIWDKWMPKT